MADDVGELFRDIFYGDSRTSLFSHFRDSAFYQRLFLKSLLRDRDFFLEHLLLLQPFWSHFNVKTWDIPSAVQLHLFLEKEKEFAGQEEEANLLLRRFLKELKDQLSLFLQLSKFHELGFRSFFLPLKEGENLCLEEVRKTLKNHDSQLRKAVHIGFIFFLEVAEKFGWKLTKLDRNGNSLLHLAALNGDKVICKFLVKKGFSYELSNKEGRSSCHLAVLSRSVSLMAFTVEQGASPFHKDRFSESPLLLAARLGFRSFLESILGVRTLRSEKFLQEMNRAGQTLLHYAVLYSYVDLVSYLINLGFYVNIPDSAGDTPLHIAAHSGSLEVCDFLLSKGSDPDRKNARGQSPLHIAATDNKIDVVRKLIDYSAHVNGRDLLGQTALHLAIIFGSLDAATILLKIGQADPSALTLDQNSPLHLAVEKNHVLFIEMLCDVSASPMSKDIQLRTPLHLACELGHFESVETLMAHVHINVIGQLMKQVNFSGKNLIHASVLGKHIEILTKILSHKQRPNLDQMDSYGIAPVQLAVQLGEKSCFDVLWKAGANFLISDKNGVSPLHEACRYNRSAMTNKILESQPATFSQVDQLGSIPLHTAAQYGSIACLEVLLNFSSEDVNIQNNEGQTPLHFCAASGNLLSLRILRRCKKARTDIPDRKGRTPYDLARASGIEEEMVALFI